MLPFTEIRNVFAFVYALTLEKSSADPHVLSSGKLQAAAKRLQITPEQCMYQFCLQEGITPLNGTTNEERMKLGVAVQNNRVGLLTDKEMQSVRSLMY